MRTLAALCHRTAQGQYAAAQQAAAEFRGAEPRIAEACGLQPITDLLHQLRFAVRRQGVVLDENLSRFPARCCLGQRDVLDTGSAVWQVQHRGGAAGEQAEQGRADQYQYHQDQPHMAFFAHRQLLSASVWVLPVTAYHTDGEKSSAPYLHTNPYIQNILHKPVVKCGKV